MHASYPALFMQAPFAFGVGVGGSLGFFGLYYYDLLIFLHFWSWYGIMQGGAGERQPVFDGWCLAESGSRVTRFSSSPPPHATNGWLAGWSTMGSGKGENVSRFPHNRGRCDSSSPQTNHPPRTPLMRDGIVKAGRQARQAGRQTKTEKGRGEGWQGAAWRGETHVAAKGVCSAMK